MLGGRRKRLTKKKKRRQRFSQQTPRRTRRSEPPSCRSTAIGDRQRWCGGLERRRWRGGLEQWRWWILSLSLTPIRFSLSDYMWVLVCFEFLLWVSQIGVDWISKSAAGTENRRRQRGGLEIGGDGMVVWSGGDGGFSLFLSLRFSLSNWMWVLVLL